MVHRTKRAEALNDYIENRIAQHARVNPGFHGLPKEGSPEWNDFQKELEAIAEEFDYKQ